LGQLAKRSPIQLKNSPGGHTMRSKLCIAALTAFILTLSAFAQKTQVKFQVLGSTGGFPGGGTLVEDAKGNLYGANNLGDLGAGGVYEVSPLGNGKWQVTTIYDMLDFPNQGVAIDAEGNLYGGDTLGGNDGEGEVFKLSPNGDGTFSESSIYSFPGINQPGGPNGDLLLDAKGNIYGTTLGNGNGITNQTVAYELQKTANGYNYVQLYEFCSLSNCADGQYPEGGLKADAAGSLYGTTNGGGQFGQGTVYQLKQTNGKWTETVLHSFNGTDGQSPYGNINFDANGNLYGSTFVGGSSDSGVVYEIDAKGNFSVIYNFKGTPDGAFPYGAVNPDDAGHIFGTTEEGGKSNGGTVYELTQNGSGQWSEAGSYSFPYVQSEGGPLGGLLLTKSAQLFGFTATSKNFGYGEIFEFSH